MQENSQAKRNPPWVCGENSPRLGEGTRDTLFSFTLKTSASSLTFALLFCAAFILEILAGDSLCPGKEVSGSQRSPRTIH